MQHYETQRDIALQVMQRTLTVWKTCACYFPLCRYVVAPARAPPCPGFVHDRCHERRGNYNRTPGRLLDHGRSSGNGRPH